MNKILKQLLSLMLVFTIVVSTNITTRAFVPKDDDTSLEDEGSW